MTFTGADTTAPCRSSNGQRHIPTFPTHSIQTGENKYETNALQFFCPSKWKIVNSLQPGTSQRSGQLHTPSSLPHPLHRPHLHHQTPFHRCSQSPLSSAPSPTSSHRTFHLQPRKEEFWTQQLQGSFKSQKNLGLISLPPTRQSSATHPSPDSGLATSEGAPGDPSPPLLPPSPPPFSEGLTQVAFLSLPIPQLQVPSFPSDRSQPGLRTSG